MGLVNVAFHAGADAIKLQTFTPEQMVDTGTTIMSGPWMGRNAFELYCECHTPRAWHKAIFDHAKELGLIAFSSVFHQDDIDFLETLDCQMYKVSSFEILDIPLIRRAAKTGKPLIISTGMATWQEITEATLAGGMSLTLLKCTSAYPSKASDANLLAGEAMANSMVYPPPKWGVSDHTLGLSVAVAATARGATMIEKHLTLSRSDGGPDAGFSSEPHEFAAMVVACREAAAAIGEVRYGPTESEMSSLPLRRKPGGKRGG